MALCIKLLLNLLLGDPNYKHTDLNYSTMTHKHIAVCFLTVQMDQVYNLKVHNAVLWKKLEEKGMREEESERKPEEIISHDCLFWFNETIRQNWLF